MSMVSELPRLPLARIEPSFTKFPSAFTVDAAAAARPVAVVSTVALSNVGLAKLMDESPENTMVPEPRMAVFCEKVRSGSSIVPLLVRTPTSPGFCGPPVGDQLAATLASPAVPAERVQVYVVIDQALRRLG